ncbi:unnamed protein product, partial [Rangifer tarandus platyrhynchus]
ARTRYPAGGSLSLSVSGTFQRRLAGAGRSCSLSSRLLSGLGSLPLSPREAQSCI